MQDNNPEVTMLRVDDGAYAVLAHVYDDNKLVDVHPIPIFAFLIDSTATLRAVVTLSGPMPMHAAAIWGPDGTVIRGQETWASLDSYVKWGQKGGVQ